MTGAAPGGAGGGAGGGGGFLEFFILEAGDYVEQLDGVLLGAGTSGTPDGDAMQRVARALRGTATMAKLPTFAELAQQVERVGRALQQGSLQWEPALRGALTSAVDDLKLLLRAARNWSATDDQRATARSSELARYAPATPRPSTAASQPAAAAPGAGSFFAVEASNIAAGLELLTTRAGGADTAANVLRRVRALRGVAGVKEIAPLADALEATEDAARNLESGQEEMGPEARQLLEAAAAYLRSIASALRGDGDVNAPGSARDAFAGALENWTSRMNERERVVPIADLFYADGAPGLLEASQSPPTSMAQRFRLELVSLGEHLRQVVDGARQSSDSASTTRSRRDLKRALHALRASAESFGEHDVAEFIGSHLESADHVDFLGLAALEDLAKVLADPGTDGEKLHARLNEISGGRDLSSAIGIGFGDERVETRDEKRASGAVLSPRPSSPLSIATPAFTSPAQPAAARPPAVSEPPVAPEPPVTAGRSPVTASLDQGAAALIEQSIAALDSLNTTPFAAPTPLPEDEIVPIETLLYRGRAALDRAVELRDEMKRAGASPDAATLDELFDLIELARAG